MIIIPTNSLTIDENFEYAPGVMVSPNVSLDALTVGDTTNNAPFVLQRTSPLFIDFDTLNYDPFATGRQALIAAKWQIAANLQYLAYGVVEPLIKAFPSGLMALCAYLDPERAAPDATFDQSKHFSGEAIDVVFYGATGNVYQYLGDVLTALNDPVNGLQFTEMGLCFSAVSWLHIGIAGPYTYSGGDYINPRIFTRDFVSGESYTGFMPCRGFS